MKTLRRSAVPRDAQLASGGRVACPWRDYEDIDVECCLTCPRVRASDLKGPVPWVRCERPLRPLRW